MKLHITPQSEKEVRFGTKNEEIQSVDKMKYLTSEDKKQEMF